MSTLATKNARVELKTTKEAKELLTKAAILEGVDLSSFMLSSSIEKARKILLDHTSIALSEEGQAKLVNLLQNQTSPTEEMVELRRLPRLQVRGE